MFGPDSGNGFLTRQGNGFVEDDGPVLEFACGGFAVQLHGVEWQKIDLAQKLGDEAVGRPLIDVLRLADLQSSP